MFAGIENQKNPSALQKCNETRRCIVRLNRLPQHGGDGRRCELRISQHPEIDEEDRTREGVHQVMCNGDRDRRLADATSADDGDKARSGQVGRQLQDIIIPADDSAQAAGKVGVRKIGGGGRRHLGRAASTRDRRDEAIALSGEGRNISRAVLSVAERLA